MKKLFLLTILALCAAPLAAQELHLIKTQAPKTAPFAQPFTVQYDFSHTPGYQITLDEESLSSDFEIQDKTSRENSPGTLTYELTALPFVLGKSTFTATFNLTQNGQTAAQAQEPVYINVTPVKIFNDNELREIRPPYVPAGWLAWLIACLLALACAGVLYYWYKQTREKKLAVQEQDDTRPSDVIALSKIDALLNSGLWERQEYKLFYITLSDILREYLWRQFHIDASADTSAELLRRLKTQRALAPLLYSLRDFLSSGDLVKFARVIPEEQIRNKDVQILRRLITETAPKETVEPRAAALLSPQTDENAPKEAQ